MPDSLIILAAALLGGWCSRMCGGGWPPLPYRIDRFVYAAPYAALFWIHGGFKMNFDFWVLDHGLLYIHYISFMTFLGLLSYGAALAGKVTGHGQYLHYGTLPQQPASQNEELDFIVTFFMGRDVAPGQYPSYWRCAAGMVVTGLAETLLSGLLYAATIDPLKGAVIALSGALKTLGYQAGYFIEKRGFKKIDANVYGEFFNGFKGWGLLAWAAL